jgi:hypothetical protein
MTSVRLTIIFSQEARLNGYLGFVMKSIAPITGTLIDADHHIEMIL